MLQRRIVYLTVLAAAAVFYWASRAWLSGIALMAVVGLPLLSLLLSLPAMLSSRLSLQCPGHVTVGIPARTSLEVDCRFPTPASTGKLRLIFPVTGKKKRIVPGGALPTEHCGAILLQCSYIWMCDYLGLWRLPKGLRESRTVLVRPAAILPAELPDMSRYLCNITRPKPGGGYAENHELRLYRPGDNPRQIHWKLSAKTGELIIREPMEAQQEAALLTMELRGSLEVLDRKLGKLLGMSVHLAQQGVRHRICCYTGKGMVFLPVSNETESMEAIDLLLQQPMAEAEGDPVYPKAVWRYHVGGDGSGQ